MLLSFGLDYYSSTVMLGSPTHIKMSKHIELFISGHIVHFLPLCTEETNTLISNDTFHISMQN